MADVPETAFQSPQILEVAERPDLPSRKNLTFAYSLFVSKIMLGSGSARPLRIAGCSPSTHVGIQNQFASSNYPGI